MPIANLLGGETHVNVVITRYAGTDNEKVEKRTVILRRANEQVEVLRVADNFGKCHSARRRHGQPGCPCFVFIAGQEGGRQWI